MLSTLITSKTRIKILVKFFINHEAYGYLRNLESEFGESCNAVRIELNRFEKAGLLATSTTGNKKLYKANTSHPLCHDLKLFLTKMVGIDYLANSIVPKIPNLESAYITGSLPQSVETNIYDLVLVGTNIDKAKVSKLVDKFEDKAAKKIRFLILKPAEVHNFTKNKSAMLIWKKEEVALVPDNG